MATQHISMVLFAWEYQPFIYIPISSELYQEIKEKANDSCEGQQLFCFACSFYGQHGRTNSSYKLRILG